MCFRIVKDSWEEEGNNNVAQEIKSCAASLDVWGREIIGCFNKRFKECKNRLKLLRNKRDVQSVEEYEIAKKAIILGVGPKINLLETEV